MSTARSASLEPDLIDQLVAGHDARAVFERNGILDKLRAALNERFPDDIDRLSGNAFAARRAPERGVEVRDTAEIADLQRFQVRYPDLSERIVSLHARGYPQIEIQRRASMLIGQPVPPEAIAGLLDGVRREAMDWQSRALEPNYPIVVFERVRVKWRDDAGVRNRVCHFALGFQSHGPKEVLGLWFEGDDEARHWTDVLTDLKARGVADVLYFLGSGSQLMRAKERIFPSAAVVANIGDYVRQSLDLAVSKDRSGLAKALRAIHGASTAEAAEQSLARFAQSTFGDKYPAIAPLWRRHWSDLAGFFDIPFEVRRVMASTHAADALRRGYARTLKGHGHMKSTQDAIALMYLVVRESLRKWRRPQREWHAAKTQLAVLFPERFVAN